MKRVLCAIMVLVAFFSLASCGMNNDNKSESNKTKTIELTSDNFYQYIDFYTKATYSRTVISNTPHIYWEHKYYNCEVIFYSKQSNCTFNNVSIVGLFPDDYVRFDSKGNGHFSEERILDREREWGDIANTLFRPQRYSDGSGHDITVSGTVTITE